MLNFLFLLLALCFFFELNVWGRHAKFMVPYALCLFVKIALSNHVVVILLSLEFLSLVVLAIMSAYLLISNLAASFILAFLTAAVCEACIGLGVLIKSTRTLGSDKMSNLK